VLFRSLAFSVCEPTMPSGAHLTSLPRKAPNLATEIATEFGIAFTTVMATVVAPAVLQKRRNIRRQSW